MTWENVDTGPDWKAVVSKNTDYKDDDNTLIEDYFTKPNCKTEVKSFIQQIRDFMTRNKK